MTQQAKKQSSQPAVKLASTVVNKTAKSSIDVMESTRASAESAVEIGSAAAKDLLANSSSEAKKAQEKVFEMGREGAEKISKSADVVTKSLYEAISASRDNVETAIECGNLTASFAKDISSELVEYANKAFSDNVELSKSMFACRTINDMIDLQNKIVKNSCDSFFGQSSKLTNMLFEYSTEALEPINERVAQTTEQLSKKLSGAA
ncbi:MAG: phasin family protein [Rickettsiales bacterium]|jgi:phasin family protein